MSLWVQTNLSCFLLKLTKLLLMKIKDIKTQSMSIGLRKWIRWWLLWETKTLCSDTLASLLKGTPRSLDKPHTCLVDSSAQHTWTNLSLLWDLLPQTMVCCAVSQKKQRPGIFKLLILAVLGFLPACEISLIVVSLGYSSLRCAGFSW